MTRQIDFTRGNLTKQLILFSVPLVMGELLQNLYNSVDILVVGKLVGDTALAAVSVCSTLSNLLIGFFNGMSVGAIIVVSRVFGSKQQETLGRYVRVIFTFSAILGVTLSVFGIFGAEFLLALSAPADEFYLEALTYLRIYLAGLMFTVIYNVGAGILRAIGDFKTPFTILLATSCINIVLDLLFVAVFHLGVAGVSLATVIAQLLSVLMVSKKIGGINHLKCFAFGETIRDGRSIILEVLKIGMPSGLQNSLISFSNLFVWRYVNQFGYAATAGVGVAQRLDKFISLPCKAFGTTVTTCIGQNIGARNYDRVHEGVRKCTVLSLTVIIALELLIFTFRYECVALFNTNQEVISIGAAMLQVIVPLYVFFAIREILYGILRGHGYTSMTTILSLVGMIGIRQLFLTVTMRMLPSLANIYWCYPVAWGSTTLLIYIYYLVVKRRSTWECDRGITKNNEKAGKEALL